VDSICCVLAIHYERWVGELTKLQISVQKYVLLKHIPSLVILLTGCKGVDLVGGLETKNLFWRLVYFFIRCRLAWPSVKRLGGLMKDKPVSN
jgi:hypothetical protein